MKARLLVVLAMLLVLLMAGAVPATAGRVAPVPFVGYYAMHPVIAGMDEHGCFVQQLPGEGRATHVGPSTWYSDATFCPATGIQSGDATWTADTGEKLFGGFRGTAHVVMTDEGPIAEFEGDYWMDGGTGRFTGYTGTGIYWGTATVGGAEETGELYFLGALVRP